MSAIDALAPQNADCDVVIVGVNVFHRGGSRSQH